MEQQPQEKNGKSKNNLIFFKALIWAGVLLSLLTPFLRDDNSFFPYVGAKSLFFMGCAEIVIFAWLALMVLDRKYIPRMNLIIISVLAYIAVFALATIFSVDPTRSFWSKFERMGGLLMHLHLLGFFLAVSSFFKKLQDWKKIFLVSVGLSFVMCLVFFCFAAKMPWAVQQFASSQNGLYLGNKSFLGTYLLFNAFFAIYLFLKEKNEYIRIFCGITFATIAFVMQLAQTRAMLFGFLGGLFLFAMLFFWVKTKNNKQINAAISSALILGCVLAAIFVASIPIIGISSPNLMSDPNATAFQKIYTWPAKTFMQVGGAGRMLVWKAAWPMIMHRPILGWGPENFELLLYKHFDARLFTPEWGSEAWFDRAHNIVMDTIATVGFLGFLAYLGIFFASFWVLSKRYQENKAGEEYLELCVFVPLLAAYFAQNLTVFDMVASFMMFYLSLAFLSSLLSKERASELKETDSFSLVKMGIIAVSFLLCFMNFVCKPYVEDRGVIDLLRMYQSGTKQQIFSMEAVDARIDFYKKKILAGRTGIYQVRDFLPDIFVDVSRSGIAWTISKDAYKKEISFWLSEMEEGAKTPGDYRAKLKLGYFYGIYGATLEDRDKVAQGITTLEEAKKLSPNNPQTFWFLAQLEIFNGDFKKALDYAMQSLALNKDIVHSRSTAVEIATRLVGDYDLAEKLAREGIQVFTDRQKVPGNNVEWSKEQAALFTEMLKQIQAMRKNPPKLLTNQ